MAAPADPWTQLRDGDPEQARRTLRHAQLAGQQRSSSVMVVATQTIKLLLSGAAGAERPGAAGCDQARPACALLRVTWRSARARELQPSHCDTAHLSRGRVPEKAL